MPRRCKSTILLCCSLPVIVAILLWRVDREPFYRGQSLSAWVASYDNDSNKEAADAIRHIGVKGIPHLLQWIQYEPSNSRQEWLYQINKVTGWIHDRLVTRGDWSIYDGDRRRAPAVPKAFAVLGPQAKLAVPALTGLLNDPNLPWTAARAARALAYLGESGLPPLMAALNGTNAQLRQIALGNIQYLGTNARPLVPSLILILGNEAEGNSMDAANVLGHLRIESDRTVPALVKSLSSPNLLTREMSAMALTQYGPLARPAIPALTVLLTGSDQSLRNIATRVLCAIDTPSLTTTAQP